MAVCEGGEEEEEEGGCRGAALVAGRALGSTGGDSMLASVRVRAVGVVAVWLPLSSLRPPAALTRAGGGSSNGMCRVASCFNPSRPWMSVDEPGVGGSAVRGIVEEEVRGGAG